MLDPAGGGVAVVFAADADAVVDAVVVVVDHLDRSQQYHVV